MNTLHNLPLKALLAFSLIANPWFADDLLAANPDDTPPLSMYRGDNGSFLKATIQADLAVFNQGNSWFGNSKGVLGEQSDFWWESLLRPGIEGSFTATRSQKLYGRLDVVQANTGTEIDGGGTNIGLGSVSNLRIENGYAGWRSGTLFSSFGEDFLDISFGRQQYIAGTGFLFSSEGGAGYKRAAYYLGGRKSAEYAGIIRMKSGGWSGDLFYLEGDDIAEKQTRAGGATVDYAFEKMGNIGGGVYSVESEKPALDAMKIHDIRGGIKPFELSEGLKVLQPLTFEAEYVHEENVAGFDQGRGWYLAASYQFENIPWKPKLTYRYASFNENYQTLFYGACDWGTWFQGEIIGEYVLFNKNLDSDMIRLKITPIEPVTVNLMYYRFTLHDPAAFTENNATASPVTSDDYADEVDLIIDWAVNDHFTLSLVGAYAEPGEAAVQHTGGSDNWTTMMLWGCVKF